MDAKWQGITVKKLLHDGIVLIGLYLFVPFCETDLISKSQRRQTAKTNKVVFTAKFISDQSLYTICTCADNSTHNYYDAIFDRARIQFALI